jgi:hypothetical protein
MTVTAGIEFARNIVEEEQGTTAASSLGQDHLSESQRERRRTNLPLATEATKGFIAHMKFPIISMRSNRAEAPRSLHRRRKFHLGPQPLSDGIEASCEALRANTPLVSERCVALRRSGYPFVNLSEDRRKLFQKICTPLNQARSSGDQRLLPGG